MAAKLLPKLFGPYGQILATAITFVPELLDILKVVNKDKHLKGKKVAKKKIHLLTNHYQDQDFEGKLLNAKEISDLYNDNIDQLRRARQKH